MVRPGSGHHLNISSQQATDDDLQLVETDQGEAKLYRDRQPEHEWPLAPLVNDACGICPAQSQRRNSVIRQESAEQQQ
jgi:hypothetical protein